VDKYYVEQFLLDTKTYAPRLREIEVFFDQLITVTENFTRDATRRNCVNIKRLIFERTIEYPEELYPYFPSLVNCFFVVIINIKMIIINVLILLSENSRV
jgi:hypothetical protein